eukprot:CAMPEP_0177584096 /NCGR_PEP_ID=MMETSP0419_2-20121207/3702_1 /TAXON_ID=582737 /ORGANISM="Tetraselmis sp., Strain GSL018" /LENGTH=321 /DNA_ID=CAMNT_0019073589 /DNA_START=207 /DNA_END=1171 /DNA_ORIENTATION=+
MTFGEQNSLKEAHQILELAWDKGINFLDTAEMYPIAPRRETQGLTSTIVGEWLKQRDRSSVVVATKVLGHSDRQQWVPASRYVPRGPEKVARVDRESIRAACEAELRRLQTDYIDLLYVHWPDRYVPAFGTHRYRLNRERSAVPFEEQVEAIGALIAEGKVRHWALSNETPYGVMSHVAAADAAGVPRPVALQQSYSLLHREAEGALAELASSPGSTSAAPARMGPGMALFPNRYTRFMSDRSLAAASRYAEIAAESGMTPAQLAYAFCGAQWFIPSTIIGATTVEQLQENIAAFSFKLDGGVLQAIDRVYLEHRDPALED